MSTNKLQQSENELDRLNAELQRRTQEIEGKRISIEQYQAMLRRLKGASVLDGTDNTQEIASAQAELLDTIS